MSGRALAVGWFAADLARAAESTRHWPPSMKARMVDAPSCPKGTRAASAIEAGEDKEPRT